MLNVYQKHLERKNIQASFCTSCPPVTKAVYCQAQHLTYISAANSLEQLYGTFSMIPEKTVRIVRAMLKE